MLAFVALADPNRLRIIELLAMNGQLAAGDISKKFTISAPAISQHLKVLREAKLVQVEVHAQQRLYSLNTDSFHAIEGWANAIQRLWATRFDALDELLKPEMK